MNNLQWNPDFFDMASVQQNHIVKSGHRCERVPDFYFYFYFFFKFELLAAKQLMISLYRDMACKN